MIKFISYKNEFKQLLDQVNAKHIVFEMSQCYSGGFQQMAITNIGGYPHANPKICGFTAVTPDHYASGCTANADGATYKGYERSFTEGYTGISIPTGKNIFPPATSIFVAHQYAILNDKTVDTPISTSDYYLLEWAKLFTNPDFKSRLSTYSTKQIKNVFNNYNKYTVTSPDLLSFKRIAHKDQDLILAMYPDSKDFMNLNLLQKKHYIDKLEKEIAEWIT